MNQVKIEFYQKMYKYALDITNFVTDLKRSQANKVIGEQLLKSGTSVAANIIEAKAASSRRDFVKFYYYSLKSANETKLWLALIRDTQPEQKEKTKVLIKETVEIANILGASIVTMKRKK